VPRASQIVYLAAHGERRSAHPAGGDAVQIWLWLFLPTLTCPAGCDTPAVSRRQPSKSRTVGSDDPGIDAEQ
jgi:hypothetical protein